MAAPARVECRCILPPVKKKRDGEITICAQCSAVYSIGLVTLSYIAMDGSSTVKGWVYRGRLTDLPKHISQREPTMKEYINEEVARQLAARDDKGVESHGTSS